MKFSPLRLSLFLGLLSLVLCPLLRADVVINEIHYEPGDDDGAVEFVELFNSGGAPVDLSGWMLADAVEYTFPAGTAIDAGGFVVVAEDPAALKSAFGVTALGPWAGQVVRVDELGNIIEQLPGRLNNDGERVVLVDGAGQEIDRVDYKVRFPWPIGPGGDGGSMELINASLDNDLGSSWRTSLPPGILPEATLLPQGSSWKFRRGDSEASDPIDAWRGEEFVEDGTWFAGLTPIGFGGVTDVEFNTPIENMQNVHTGVFARTTFAVAPGEIPSRLLVRMQVDDGLILWINGEEVTRFKVDGDPTFESTASGSSTEGRWEEVTVEGVGAYVKEGINTVAVQAFNSTLGGSDFGFDVEIIRPAPESEPIARPTPGAANSVFAENAAPNIRQVDHSPQMPKEGEAAVITAKVTDPDGVASVKLLYQLVEPGNYLSASIPLASSDLKRLRPTAPAVLEPNPEFEDPANWQTLEMKDDGAGKDAVAADSIYTIEMPAFKHRELVRYRIVVEDSLGASERVPFADDPSLNFAYYVYNGVPDYTAAESVSNNDGPHTYPAEQLTQLPVYQVITRNEDWRQCMAYTSTDQLAKASEGALTYNWDGAFVYDGVVYDHIKYRLRGANGRHQGTGKRSMKFKFNRGSHLQAKDQNGKRYARDWRVLTTAKMFGNRGEPSYGLVESLNPFLFRLVGVPAPMTHWYHFRLVDGEQEQVDQYNGDFQGYFLAQERYDSRFLDQHNMKSGNIYKLADTVNDSIRLRRYLANGAIADGTDHRLTKSEFARRQTEEWLRNHANMDRWYRWSAVKEAVRHYDWPSPSDKNMAWYFEPPFTAEN
ncbi:MAG: lamin tail domain-containing protein, partial [Verrucomicrobiae bacterium]|nr:lamin tail domain-containing protein [Verrucomicrobiae bacterium]